MSTQVLCLCCGEEYPEDGNCPNLDSTEYEHSLTRANTVASWLLANNLRRPTKLQVQAAIRLDAISKGNR